MNKPPSSSATLSRQLGLTGLAATGICSMMGAAINVVPLTLQRSVPGIGPYVLPAYLVAVIPALLAATAYAILASAMPRAGGSYVYASRSINPYLGFVASFSQWFGLSIAIGVVSYLLAPFLRDIAITLGLEDVAATLMRGPVRVGVAMAFLWTFAAINVLGIRVYERTLVPLMVLMFAGGSVVIFAGFYFEPAQFIAAVAERDGITVASTAAPAWDLRSFLPASVILFSSFIGFDSIAQAGGEAKDPNRNLPLAIGIAVIVVGSFYMLFTAAIYHTVPWQYVAERALVEDLTAPGLLGYLLPPGWTVLIIGGAAIALANDLPAMILAVSRLMFAWAEDGIFPAIVTKVNRRWSTPHVAIVGSALMASVGILGSHLAGDFFLGVDILVTSMLVNFIVVCLSVVALPRRNPTLAAGISFLPHRRTQRFVGVAGAVLLGIYLVAHIAKDLSSPVSAWYYRSTWMWVMVMAVATAIFLSKWRHLRQDPTAAARFLELPPQ